MMYIRLRKRSQEVTHIILKRNHSGIDFRAFVIHWIHRYRKNIYDWIVFLDKGYDVCRRDKFQLPKVDFPRPVLRELAETHLRKSTVGRDVSPFLQRRIAREHAFGNYSLFDRVHKYESVKYVQFNNSLEFFVECYNPAASFHLIHFIT